MKICFTKDLQEFATQYPEKFIDRHKNLKENRKRNFITIENLDIFL